MNKQETIKYLIDLMATVQMAYFKGRMEGHPLWVHERSDATTSISIDLYHFEGDGEPVCEGCNPCVITCDDGSTMTGRVFSMCYDPDDEIQPLVFSFEGGDNDTPDMDIDPEDMPEETLQNIATWLEAEIQRKPVTPPNDVTSFFFYMWNAWCKEECQKAFSAPGNVWQHFWNKWLGICKAYGVYGAAERFYAELSNNNRDLLVKRATEVYDRDCEKQ